GPAAVEAIKHWADPVARALAHGVTGQALVEVARALRKVLREHGSACRQQRATCQRQSNRREAHSGHFDPPSAGPSVQTHQKFAWAPGLKPGPMLPAPRDRRKWGGAQLTKHAPAAPLGFDLDQWSH